MSEKQKGRQNILPPVNDKPTELRPEPEWTTERTKTIITIHPLEKILYDAILELKRGLEAKG